MTCRVRLTESEMEMAADYGRRRQAASDAKGLRSRRAAGDASRYTPEGELRMHIHGVAGEIAVARFVGLTGWEPGVNTFRGADVGPFEVKARSRHDYELLIRPSTRSDAAHVLVTGEPPDLWVRGWLMSGRDGMRPEWVHSHGGGEPAWFVPHAALLPVWIMRPCYDWEHDR